MYLLEFKNLSQGINEQMYMGIILSILISSIGCHRLYNRFSYAYVRAFIIFFLPLSLTFGLFAKSYRDYYRQQSLVGLIPNLQKKIIQKNQTLFLPYGTNLNAKQFVQFRTTQALDVKKIPFLQQDDFSRILEGLNSAYLFVFDYFIFNFYWPGKFLLEIDDELELGELVIKKVFQGDSKQNKVPPVFHSMEKVKFLFFCLFSASTFAKSPELDLTVKKIMSLHLLNIDLSYTDYLDKGYNFLTRKVYLLSNTVDAIFTSVVLMTLKTNHILDCGMNSPKRRGVMLFQDLTFAFDFT